MDCTIRKKIKFYSRFGESKFVTFNHLSDHKEHFAVIFGNESSKPCPLVRLHSECITGDIFQSEHCDCGDQLNEALNIFSKIGGILLYLRQEGRGIGLYNKIDAYALQAQGIDTFTANEMLNFLHDQRDFKPAAEMLNALNITQIELITNNPDKKHSLENYGISVKNTRNTSIFEKNKNHHYLLAKQKIAGHMISLGK